MNNKIQELYKSGETIKNIAMSNNGSFVIIYGLNGYWASNISNSLLQNIYDINKKKHEIKQVFLGNNGECIILYGRNGFWQYNIPKTMADKLKEINNNNEEIKQVAIGNNGEWSILFGNNQFWHLGLSQEMADILNEITSKGHNLKQIILSNKGTGFILYGSNRFWGKGIPTETIEKLYSIYNEGKEINQVLYLTKIQNENTISNKNNNGNSKMDFNQLYPILKKSVVQKICDDYRSDYKIIEERNKILIYSKSSESFISSWEWDLNNNPLQIKDINMDGVNDYTIELFNEGGGCGGQIGENERWTLFGNDLNYFRWTHVIPYRSSSGQWEPIK
jgi:hypothetical protein